MAKTAAKPTRKTKVDYFVVAVRREYEDIWRVVSKHNTREEAQTELDTRRAYTGAFNYDNAELRVLSRAEAKKQFGDTWEYKAIGEGKTKVRVEAPAPMED
jgi:hypothetical protein